ncbi:multicopper oxidase domain-containing protein [Nocardioides sp. YIM 152588]|uniref:multicopper oxidase family protein n=1 Tax=Nocardioides sp. YIM 152588 TaxID=3158259 RepID=UPI0032E3811C
MGVFTRRAALAAGGAVGAAWMLNAADAAPARGRIRSPLLYYSPEAEPFRDRMPVPPLIDSTDVTLAARTTSHRFHADWDESPAFGYGDQTYLGPTLVSHRGQPWRLRTRNRLGEHPFAADVDHSLHGVSADFGTRPRTTTHLHGGVTPPRHDGHPLDFAAPGEDLAYRYPTRQEATHLWYHDHSLGTTRLNVYAGLAGMNLVRDRFDTGRADNPLGLPAGDFEIPLILQEKTFRDGGVQSMRSTPVVPEGSWEGGAVGDVGLVNGKVWPELPVARGLYRFRVINAASLSVWRLFFSDSMRFWVIGNDGGLLDAPVRTRSLTLGPAERVDLLVDFSALAPGETVELRNDLAPPLQAQAIGSVAMPLFCRFRATAGRGFRGPVPTRLRGGAGLPRRLPRVERPRRTRTLTIIQDVEARLPPALMSLNNLGFTTSDVEKPVEGSTEVWDLVNVTLDPHNIHLHLIHFRVLERQPLDLSRYLTAHPKPPNGTRWTPRAGRFTDGPAVPRAAWESGPKDTVRADGLSITRILVRWPTAEELGFQPDRPYLPQTPTARAELAAAMTGETTGETDGGHGDGAAHAMEPGGAATRGGKVRGYLWHCHMIDHEDHDMMLPLRVVRPR